MSQNCWECQLRNAMNCIKILFVRAKIILSGLMQQAAAGMEEKKKSEIMIYMYFSGYAGVYDTKYCMSVICINCNCDFYIVSHNQDSYGAGEHYA